MSNVWIAFGLTLFAGAATGIGSIIAFTAKRTDHRFLSIATGFSAGVMLYVSFVEILAKGAEALTLRYGDYWGNWVNAGSFFAGILLIGIIDNLIPARDNPHAVHSETECRELQENGGEPVAERADGARADAPCPERGDVHDHELMRMGLFTALAIAIHNFPEGLATFLAALQDPSLGVAIAVAVALHNIPEGVSVSVPIYYATGDRKRAFIYSVLSGLSEPVGALIAYLAIQLVVGGSGGVIPPQVMGVLFGAVAGIMVYISLDELLPTSRAYGQGHDSLFGLVGGMAVMALSLLVI